MSEDLDRATEPLDEDDPEAVAEYEETLGTDLPPDETPEGKLSGNLSDEDPEGREERAPPPPAHDVTEDGED